MEAPISSSVSQMSQQAYYPLSRTTSNNQVSGQQQQSGATTTAPFLQNFSLVAEAAKRAQMAVLMRDMEACGL